MGIDCSMIRNVRVPHEQFVAIKNKAKYLIVEDRDKGGCVCFDRAKEVSEEEADREFEDMKRRLKELNERLDCFYRSFMEIQRNEIVVRRN